MAAIVNPSGNQQGSIGGGEPAAPNGGGEPTGEPNNRALAAPTKKDLAVLMALNYNYCRSTAWSPEEQKILEEGLKKYASESYLIRLAKIADQLHEKTVRCVALRIKLMAKNGSSKGRKQDCYLSKKSKDKKNLSAESSAEQLAYLSAPPTVYPYSIEPIVLEDDDDISFDDQTRKHLEILDRIDKQIVQNNSNLKAQENFPLFLQSKEILNRAMAEIRVNYGDVMKHMPPLPVLINEELYDSTVSSSGPWASDLMKK